MQQKTDKNLNSEKQNAFLLPIDIPRAPSIILSPPARISPNQRQLAMTSQD